jgi:hypothetical protein
MRHITKMYDKVHLYVEHTVGEQPHIANMNPLIEYPIQNVGIVMEEIVEEVENVVENDGTNVAVLIF